MISSANDPSSQVALIVKIGISVIISSSMPNIVEGKVFDSFTAISPNAYDRFSYGYIKICYMFY